MATYVFASASLLMVLLVAMSSSYKSNDAPSCTRLFDINNNTIIKTTESLDIGARYLKALKASSRQECMMFCCDVMYCNVAVLQEKDEGDCYLFDCGSFNNFKCKFSAHANHVAMALMGDRESSTNPTLTTRYQSKHEQDLSNLKNGVRGYGRPDSVFPDRRNVFANYSVRLPLNKRIPFRGQKLCDDNQFKCETSSQCIAIYDKCDGISQCVDGSDEKYCDSAGIVNPGDSSFPDDREKTETERLNHYHSQTSSKINNVDRNFVSSHSNRQPSNGLVDASASIVKQNNGIKSSQTNNDRIQSIDKGRVGSQYESRDFENEAGSSLVVAPQYTVIGDETQDSASIDRLDYGSSDTSLAAVLLGLGLAILALLLIFVLCKLRKARRRLRRAGKVLNANEDEFLINGMYL